MHHLVYYMKSTKATRLEVAEVQCKVDMIEERAMKVNRAGKKAQVILTKVGVETNCLKEALQGGQ